MKFIQIIILIFPILCYVSFAAKNHLHNPEGKKFRFRFYLYFVLHSLKIFFFAAKTAILAECFETMIFQIQVENTVA